jgi:hypothetical protein
MVLSARWPAALSARTNHHAFGWKGYGSECASRGRRTIMLQLAVPASSQERTGFAKEAGYVGASGLRPRFRETTGSVMITGLFTF